MHRKNLSEQEIDNPNTYANVGIQSNQKRREKIVVATAAGGIMASVLTAGVLAPPSALAVVGVFSWSKYKQHKENNKWNKEHKEHDAAPAFKK